MRIGDILLAHDWVPWEALVLALEDQGKSGVRLCSLLVSRGVLDFDHASLALGEQHGMPAVMKRHLVGRDRNVAALLPAATGRRLFALPIGRQASGKLIVAVRDPWPALRAALAKAIGEDVVLALAPAKYLERIVEQTYIDVPIDVEEEDTGVEVDVETEELDDTALMFDDADRDPGTSFDDIRVEIEPPGDDGMQVEIEPPGDDGMQVEIEPPGDDGMQVEIDPPDEPADDFAIDVEMPAPRTKPRPVRIKPVEIKPVASEAARDSLDETIARFADIDELQWLLDIAMGYVEKRWRAALLLAIEERRATGVRGHGRTLKARAISTFVLVLTEPSIVQLARDERRLATEAPTNAGIGHASLVAALDDAKHAAAVPLVKAGAVAYVLAVGDPLAGDAESAALDLEVLAEAMSTVLDRT